MYTRKYFNDTQTEIKIPEGYDGIALGHSPQEHTAADLLGLPAQKAKKKETPISTAEDIANTDNCEIYNGEDGSIPTSATKLNYFSFLKNICPKGATAKNLLSDIGYEEILILGLAAFMFFFGKDTELALMLIFLFFAK